MDEETQKAFLRMLRQQNVDGYLPGEDVLDSIYEQLAAGKQYFTAGEIIRLSIGEDYYSD